MDGIKELILEMPDMQIATDTNTFEFKEFCGDLNSLDSIISTELYLEEVNDGNMTLKKAFQGTIKNTTNTTLDVAGAYGNIVSGNANVIKGFWDLFMRALNLGTRIIAFILKKISYIPRLILKVGNKVADLPSDIINKIQGNIKLYITVNDIKNLYNNHLLNELATFIGLSKRLAEGDTWGTFFHKRKKDSDGKRVNENDIKISKQMGAIYVKIKSLEFTQSTIYMNNEDARKQYFGTTSIIEFTDLNGKHHNSSYYEALIQLIDDIKEQEDNLKAVHAVISNKYSETQMNQEFSKLNTMSRQMITNGMQMVSKMLTVTGNIIRYIMIDMKTIETETDKMLKASGVNTK